jgi:hypothetical protein
MSNSATALQNAEGVVLVTVVVAGVLAYVIAVLRR